MGVVHKATVTLGETTYTYDGKVKTPGVKSVVLNGKTLVEGADYTVTVPTGRKNAETYTYTVTGMGAYKGTAKGTYTIKVKVTAKGNANYKAMTTSVAVTIKVK